MNRSLKSFALAVTLLVAAPLLAAGKGALSIVPANAATVGLVKLGELRTSPLSSTLFEHTDKIGGNDEADNFLRDAGLDPMKDVDVVVFSSTPRANLGSEADFLVVAEGRYNVERLTTALVTRGATKKGAMLLLPEKSGDAAAVAFPSATLAIIGTENGVATALSAYASGGTGFSSAAGLAHMLGRVDSNASAWLLIDVPRASRLMNAPKAPTNGNSQHDAVFTALKSLGSVALWGTDTGDSLKLGGVGLSNDGETLQLLEDTVRGALSAMRLAVKDKNPEMVSVLRKFDVSRTDDSISVTGSIPASFIKEMAAKQHNVRVQASNVR